MIGWKCKAGYASGNITSLSDVTFTDESYYTMITNYVDNTLPRYTARYGIEEGRDVLENALNKDYYYIYGSISYKGFFYSNKLLKDTIEYIFPSIFIGYKNLNDYFNSNTPDSTINPAIYIEGLKRLLVGTSMYSVDGNNIKFLGNKPLPTPDQWYMDFNIRVGNGASFPCIINYSSDLDLKQSKICAVSFNVDSNPTGMILGQNIGYYDSNWINLFFGNYTEPDIIDVIPPDNPYEPGGDSEEGGGNGTFDDESDQIEDSTLPTLSSANTGFTRIYNPTLEQVQQLAQYLWTTPDVIETIWNHIKQFFEDPMEAIIGFNLVPVKVPDGGNKNFALMFIDTGVSMNVAANQFVDVDCGTLEIKKYYGSALDYSPNTKVSAFLPFIGMVELNTDEVMGRTLQVKYRVDICSGSCVAKIFVDGNVLYQYSGHCAISIPINSADFSSYVSAAISVAKLAVGAAAAGVGGAMAAGASVEATQQTNQVVTTSRTTTTARNPSTGRQITTGTRTTVETRESPIDQSSTQASFSGLSPANISNTVGQIMGAKPHVEHSGSFSGNTGYLGVRRPYVIIERPNMCMPKNYQQYNGFPSMITMTLGDCTGFTQVQQVQLTGVSATNPEQAEILTLLKSGVIL